MVYVDCEYLYNAQAIVEMLSLIRLLAAQCLPIPRNRAIVAEVVGDLPSS